MDLLFFQHLGADVHKVKFPVTSLKKKEGQVRELIHRSIGSEEELDVFRMARIARFDISIISDDLLAKAKSRRAATR